MSLSNEAILRTISNDRALGAAMLFPHRHRQASPPFHIHLMDLWRGADPLVVIEAFREGAKTTLSEEFLLMEAAFGNFGYALIFGETYTKACQRIEAIKHEVATNQKLFALFGNLKGTTWSENRIMLKNGCMLEAHGWEEEIRGYKHHDMRPDRAYLDDIENQERVRDTFTVDQNWKKVHLQLIPAMDKEGKVRITGTPLADDCMIRRAFNSPNWVHAQFPICNGDIDDPRTEALWPSRYPMEWIREKRDHFAAEGMLREFNQEYMLIASGSQGKPFPEDKLVYCDVAPVTYSPKVVIMDPARTVEVKKSDQTGHVTVSRMGTKFYVHRSGGEYWQPDEIVAGAFNLSEKADDAEVVIEKNSLDDWLLQPIRAMSILTGKALNMRAINAPQDRDKAAFIMGLQPFFMAGDIILVGGRAAHPQLVSQMVNFPSGKRDILNALAYVTRAFSGLPVYGDFSEANIIYGYVCASTSALILVANSSPTETCAALLEIRGQGIVVLADWISPLVPADSVADIAMLVRAAYPRRKITTWVPGDVFDQMGRNPLITALAAAKLPANRAGTATMARGALSPMIRTGSAGRRLFQVDEHAKNTLQALAMGYNFPVKPGGEKSGAPAPGPAKTLMEAIETCVFAIQTAEQLSNLPPTNAVNSMGAKYLSALPGR